MTCHKASYMSQAEAQVCARNHKKGRGGSPRPYRCPSCAFWHLTTMTKSTYRNVRRLALS